MIIDSHVHIGTMLTFNMPEDMVIVSMEKYNIDFSLVSNCQAAEYNHNLEPISKEHQISQAQCFLRTIEFARRYPNKIGVTPWVKPATEGVNKEFEKILKENIDVVYGIKVHPFHSKTPFDSPRIEEYIKLAQNYSLPVVTHTGGCDEASPIRVYNMAKKYPKVNFVMVHMGLGTDNTKALELLGKLPNLFGDTTWVPMETTIKAIKLYGSEKMLFGSDSPIDGVDTYDHNPKGEPSVYRKYFREINKIITKEEYDNLMYKNAIKIFNIVH